MTVLVEACVDSLAAAHQAAIAGAARLELCQNLDQGGTTPDWKLATAVREQVRLPLHVLIRPRAGDFHYRGDELEAMAGDIARAQALGAQGVVFGGLDTAGGIDETLCRRLLGVARPLTATFHRAFDEVPDPAAALERLVGLGFERVLTSGQAATALLGTDRLAALVVQARGRIGVLAGGGIRAHNVRTIVAATGVREVHSSGGREGIRGIVEALARS
jgi:copper homeostasis protein